MNARTDRRLDAIERRHQAGARGDAAEMTDRVYVRFETAVSIAAHGLEANRPWPWTWWRDRATATNVPPADMTLEEAAEIAAPFGGLEALELYGDRYRRGEYRPTRDLADTDAGTYGRALAAAARQEGAMLAAANLEAWAAEHDGQRLADLADDGGGA